MDERPLTPRQQEALDELLALGRPRPSFAPDLAGRLRAMLEGALAGAASHLADTFAVRKADLTQVHTCETHHVHERARQFEWSARSARGTVAHKAIELSVHVTERTAAELVDLAVARIVDEGSDWGPAGWLRGASEVELAELRAGAMDVVHKFQDEFPPVKRSWRPRVESAMACTLCDERILLRGRVDLALGQARGTEARVMVVDFKTGSRAGGHVDDLRFYALLETLRVGVPPFRVASWYLDSGQWHAEDVDEDVLAAAARRTADGVRKLIELHVGRRPARLTPGPTCGWCSCATTCTGARTWADQRAELGLG